MQILANYGYENKKTTGLGWISGEVKMLKNKILPHMGWNNVKIKDNSKKFFRQNQDEFYFVHSYHFITKNNKNCLGISSYGQEFCSIISQDNILGVQFHPEKSQVAGLNFLKDILDEKKRLIPVVLYKDGFIVQGRQFKEYLNIGNATDSIKRYSEWAADELIYLNIGENKNDIRREDANFENRQDFLDIIKIVCKNAFMPIAVGGKIDNINYARKLFKNGADKIVINSSFVKEPNILEKFSKEFGAQSIVVSLDFKLIKRQYEIFYNNGKTKSLINQKEIFSKINKYSGEVLLNSVTMMAWEMDLIISLLIE